MQRFWGKKRRGGGGVIRVLKGVARTAFPVCKTNVSPCSCNFFNFFLSCFLLLGAWLMHDVRAVFVSALGRRWRRCREGGGGEPTTCPEDIRMTCFFKAGVGRMGGRGQKKAEISFICLPLAVGTYERHALIPSFPSPRLLWGRTMLYDRSPTKKPPWF